MTDTGGFKFWAGFWLVFLWLSAIGLVVSIIGWLVTR